MNFFEPTSDTSALAQNLSLQLDELQKQLSAMKADSTNNNDAFFNVSMALIIFLMQCGFAFLEAGAVRSKNCTNILIKNVLDSLLAIIAYSVVGWALAFGPNAYPSLDPFFGFSEFFMDGTTRFSYFFFQFVFAATASTIISGAVAERAQFGFFLIYNLLITSFTYPILTHWGWSPNGWMARGVQITDSFRTTYIDFAGAGMVHVTGGTISLIAAYMIGPRIGRFPSKDKGTPNWKIADGTKQPKSVEIKGHSVPFAALGGFILIFGFLAFNGGSTAEISTSGIGQTVAKAMINTILCGAFAALAYLIIHRLRKGKWTVLLTINACLTGAVTACAGCNQMQPWTTVFVGSISGMSYLLFAEICLAMKIDDPLDAFAVHFGGGLWGLISACIFTDKGLIYVAVRGSAEEVKLNNALWQFGWQMICALAIIVWCSITMIPPFMLLKKFNKMRVPREVELRGLDISMHGEAAYPLTAYGHGWDEVENTVRPGAKEALRTLSQNTEISLEEMAAANAERKKYSLYQNPQQYEHPEHWQMAKKPNTYKRYKKSSVSPTPNADRH